MDNRSRNVLGLFILIAAMFFIFLLFVFFSVRSLKINETMMEGMDVQSDRSVPIGVVEVNGVIMESKKIVESLQMAEKDSSVKAIILRVDSPGGAVGPTQEIYEEIRRIDKIKPIYASFATVAASGGYYIGAACRRIYSNAGTLTGSIGVIMQFADLSKLLEYLKVSPFNIKAGLYKDTGDVARPMTEQERNLLKEMIAGVHQQFIRDILKTRAKKIVGNIEDHAQGQIFSGEGALKAGLVDELAGLWTAAREIHQELKLKSPFAIKFIKPKKKFSFMEFMGEVEETATDLKLSLKAAQTPLLLYKQ